MAGYFTNITVVEKPGISNTTSMTPTDIRKLSDNYIKPQRGDQFSLGLYKNLNCKSLETSVEAYYKILKIIPIIK